jgi:hypothetical protein
MSVRLGAVFGPSDHLQCEDERLVRLAGRLL